MARGFTATVATRAQDIQLPAEREAGALNARGKGLIVSAIKKARGARTVAARV